MPETVLITGGCGFVGHHFVEHFLKNTDWQILVLDKLSYASNGFDRLRDIDAYDNRRVALFTADLTRPLPEGLCRELAGCDYILHLAAETHVDNSIADPLPFVYSNVVGTANLLEFARRIAPPGRLRLFHYFSTDEVFGPAAWTTAGDGPTDPRRLSARATYCEWERYNSTNPYSASKAGGEELCLAYANTYKIPLAVTHTMNCFGERQHPEKWIPKIVRGVLAGETLTIHADSTRTRSGSRFYIHCRNVASGVHTLVEHLARAPGPARDKWNIVGEREVSNLELAQSIAGLLGRELHCELVDFHSSRPGHDLRYALDAGKMRSIGWSPPASFEASLEKTVRWMVEHPQWLYPEGK